MNLAIVIVDDPDAEMQLQVRSIDIGPAPDESAGFGGVGGQQPPPMAEVTCKGADALRHQGQCDPEQAWSVGAQICYIVAMILKILADLGRIDEDADFKLSVA